MIAGFQGACSSCSAEKNVHQRRTELRPSGQDRIQKKESAGKVRGEGWSFAPLRARQKRAKDLISEIGRDDFLRDDS